MTKKEIPLTPLTKEQKMTIWEVIENHKLPEDSDPKEVISNKPFYGDEEKYLREMAHWHKVAL